MYLVERKSHTKDADAHVEYRGGPPVHPNLISYQRIFFLNKRLY